ncbi:hypothetical protein ACEPAH_3044 [Sanghuangporus vaninii]
MPRNQLNTPQKDRIVGSVIAGCSLQEAADLHKTTWHTVKKAYNQYLCTGSTHYENQRGRNRKLGHEQQEHLLDLAQNNRRMTLRDLGTNIDPRVSWTTVRNELARRHYHRCKACHKPALQDYHRYDRAAFAHGSKSLPADWLDKVIWSDESYVLAGGSPGTIYVTQKPCEEYDDDCIVSKDEHPRFCVMIWGCIMRVLRKSWLANAAWYQTIYTPNYATESCL